MKNFALTGILALAFLSPTNALWAQGQKAAPKSTAEAQHDVVADDPEQQESQRLLEASGSTTVVKETKPSVWNTAAGKQFMTAIEPRKGRWADFDQIVFQSNVSYSEDMLSLMARSPYAADIAYYLGMHPHESAQYAAMPIDQSTPAIMAIEQKAKTEGVKSVEEPARP